jgi:hypothetical protein
MGEVMGRERRPERRPTVQLTPGTITADHHSPYFDLPALSAFAIYLALSILFFGRSLFGRLSSFHVGMGPDPLQMMWFLVWWPHALISGIDPLLTHAIWAPAGYNLAWQTSIPLASVIAIPLTLTVGPVATFNALCLLSLPLSSWCTFVLCRYLSHNYWSSLLGGYIFGFSAFMLGRVAFGHLNLLLIFSVPLTVHLVARRLAGEMTQHRFTLLLTLLLVTQFLLFLEVFTTMTMFGTMALTFGWLVGTSDVKQRIMAMLKPIAYSYGVALVIVSPYVYYFFGLGFIRGSLWSPSTYSADLLNFIIPTQTSALGTIPFLKSMSAGFGGSIADSGASLSVPLIVISMLYAHRYWREPLARLLTYYLLVIVVLSLGPAVHIGGHTLPVLLPWWPLAKLPVLDQVLPVRLSMYAFLILALIASLWLATAETRLASKIVLVAGVVLFNAPNLSATFWIRAANAPAFFSDGVYMRYLKRGETLLLLPYGDNGGAAFWQAQTRMYFNMVEGAGGAWPDNFIRWPVVESFRIRSYVPDTKGQLKAFLAAHGVDAVIVADGDLAEWQPLLSTIGVVPIRSGGVSLYRLNDNRVNNADKILLDARTRFDNDRMAMLASVANKYLADGGDIRSLSMVKVTNLNLIPKDSLIGPNLAFDPLNPPHPRTVLDPRFAYMLWLGPWADDRIAIGEYVWLPAAAPMIEKLRSIGSEIYYPVPDKLSSIALSRTDYGFLLAVLTREQLVRAAELLEMSPAQQVPSPSGSSGPSTGARRPMSVKQGALQH